MAPKAKEKTEWTAIQLRVNAQTLARIEDFHHEHRMFDRTKTIRYLINWAIDNHPKPKKKG